MRVTLHLIVVHDDNRAGSLEVLLLEEFLVVFGREDVAFGPCLVLILQLGLCLWLSMVQRLVFVLLSLDQV